jgi:hypothetical protein
MIADLAEADFLLRTEFDHTTSALSANLTVPIKIHRTMIIPHKLRKLITIRILEIAILAFPTFSL